jgi:hypothetical protein
VKLVGEEGCAILRDLTISFQRADLASGASLGHAPFHRVADFRDAVPSDWRIDGSIFLGLREEQAMWLGFSTEDSSYALQIILSGVDAVSGLPAQDGLRSNPQNYVVTPPQLWLEGRFRPGVQGVAAMEIRIHEARQAASPQASPTAKPAIPAQHGYAQPDESIAVGVAADLLGAEAWVENDRLYAYLVGPEVYRRIAGKELGQDASQDDVYRGYRLP